MSFIDFENYLLQEIEKFIACYPNGNTIEINELNTRLARASKIYDEISFYFFLKTQQEGLKLQESKKIVRNFLRLNPKNNDEAWIQMIFKKHSDTKKLGKKRTSEGKIINKIIVDYIDSKVREGLPKDKAFREADIEFSKLPQPNEIKKGEEAIKKNYYSNKKKGINAQLMIFYDMYNHTLVQRNIMQNMEKISNFKRLITKFELPEKDFVNKFMSPLYSKYFLSGFFVNQSF